MSLSQDIADMQAVAVKKIPQPVLELFRKCTGELKGTGIESGAVAEGAAMPDFSLPNANGETVSSADLLSKGPLVINFYRGGWCPYCNLELKALQDSLPEIEDLGATLVAISPEKPDHSLSTAEKNELEFEVLSDSGNAVAKTFGLVFELAAELRPIYDNMGLDLETQNGDSSFTLPVPATYVIGKDGTVIKAFVDADYTQRLEPEDVIAALKGL